MVFQRQTEGSVVCTSCGKLVAVKDDACWNCGRRNPGLWGFAGALRGLGDDLGFTKVAMSVCGLVFLLMLAAFPDEIGNRGILRLLSPSGKAGDLFGMSGIGPVYEGGRWWTLLSAGLLHGGLIHIALNMYWLNQLGPLVSKMYGPGRSIILFVLSSVGGFLLTSSVGWFTFKVLGFEAFLRLESIGLGGARNTLGASAAVFGWIGALVYYGRRTGSGVFTGQLMGFIVPLFLIGFLLPGVDNWAHFGGFGAGYLLARKLDPLRPERVDHILAGIVLFALMVLAVVFSVLVRFPLFFG